MAKDRLSIREPVPAEPPAGCAEPAQCAEPSRFARLEINLLPDTYRRTTATEKDGRGKNPEDRKGTPGKHPS